MKKNNSNQPLRIFIADDHPAIREGLKQILTDTYNNIQFGEAANGKDALKEINKGEWDIITMDINMPVKDGFQVLYELKNHNCNTPVLVLSMYGEDQIGLRAIQSGASGFMSKSEAADQLLVAVEMLRSGRKYISPGVAQQLADNIYSGNNCKNHQALSGREYQIAFMIGSGKTVSAIAGELHLSVPTISTYRARILEKLRVKSTAELISYMHRNNLINGTA
ncbi:MAG: response regulator [Bacteroidia bacterium]